MLASPHLFAGSAIAKGLRRPWLALPAAFLSHFALDRVPHLDSHGLFGSSAGLTLLESVMALLDTIVGAAVLLVLIRHRPDRRLLIVAAVLGIAIDLADNVPPWNRSFGAWAGTAWLSRFHHLCSNPVGPSQWALGLSTQAAVVVVCAWALWPRQRKGSVSCQ